MRMRIRIRIRIMKKRNFIKLYSEYKEFVTDRDTTVTIIIIIIIIIIILDYTREIIKETEEITLKTLQYTFYLYGVFFILA